MGLIQKIKGLRALFFLLECDEIRVENTLYYGGVIMVKTIIFDNHCSYWSKNYMFNKSFIDGRISYIYELIRANGYIYIDRICEIFGVRWDPHEANDVMIFGEKEPVISYKHLGDGGFKISICY